MKADTHLQHDVIAELEWDPSVDHTKIGVIASNGVVTLTGTVASFATKLAAEKAVRRVAGVKAIAEEIVVRHPADAKTSDPEIARRVLDVFSWDAAVPRDKISVKVEKGWVTLSGTVDWFYQSEAARKAASRITGVVGISNLIEVRKLPSVADVHERIMMAFKRNANLDATNITILTDGGKVTLGGKVHAFHEREIAERAAWAAPGVTRIEDNIVVA